MDNDEILGSRAVAECAEELKRSGVILEEFVVIPGTEVNSAAGHIGALFVDEVLPDLSEPRGHGSGDP